MTMTEQDQAAVREVLEADERRRAATVAGDIATLNDIMSEQFTYTHATGFREGRDGYLGRVAGGQVKYVALDCKEADVRVFGDVAIIDGRGAMSYRPGDGAAVTMHNLFLAVWRKDGGRWRVEAYGSTTDAAAV
jgi:ketosteroid isomerase-like protein